MDVELSWPYPQQQEFLEAVIPGRGVSIAHFVAGRGAGKTRIGGTKLYKSCTTWNRGLPHLWTSPTYRDCVDTFLRSWEETIPPHLWRFSRADMKITVLGTGVKGGPDSTIDIRSRQSDNSKKDPFRGPTYAGAINDEPAKDSNNRVWQLIRATIRHPDATAKFCDTISTPRLGWYHKLVTQGGGHVVYATSRDNPYLDPEFIDGLESEYSPDFAAQEIHAKWVDVGGGRIWSGFEDKVYPHGNLHPLEWDAHRPFIMCVDLGVRSAWLLLQRTPDEAANEVAVVEFTPNNEGTAQSLVRINEFTQGIPPSRVIVGRDVNTRSVGDLTKPSLYFRQMEWNPMPMIQVPMGDSTDKSWQHHVANGRLLSPRGLRRFFVSENIITNPGRAMKHGDNCGRGILDVLRLDAWPENGPRSGEHMPKDKSRGPGFEDMRDAWMYGMIMLHPARMRQGAG